VRAWPMSLRANDPTWARRRSGIGVTVRRQMCYDSWRNRRLLLVSPSVASAQAAVKAPLTIHVGALPSEVAGELFYGVDMGFSEAGLDVDIQYFNNGGADRGGRRSGALDLGSPI